MGVSECPTPDPWGVSGALWATGSGVSSVSRVSEPPPGHSDPHFRGHSRGPSRPNDLFMCWVYRERGNRALVIVLWSSHLLRLAKAFRNSVFWRLGLGLDREPPLEGPPLPPLQLEDPSLKPRPFLPSPPNPLGIEHHPPFQVTLKFGRLRSRSGGVPPNFKTVCNEIISNLI